MAMDGAPEVLDTTRVYETPEGVLLEMKIAGPVVRACAWMIDALIRIVGYLGLAVLLSFFGGVGVAVMLIGFFLIEWFYPVLFEVHDGATPGKRAMGIWVIHDNGTPVSWSSSLVRNLLRAADFMPVLYGFGLAATLIHPECKRLGDLAAGTLVVYRERPPKRIAPPDVEPLPPPQPLGTEEQLALVQYAERRELLSGDRSLELADILSDLTGMHGEGGVQRLHGYAGWLMRGR